MKTEKTIWTIGHSTRTKEEFIDMLQSFNILKLADVRQFPGSKKFPQYNKEALKTTLKQHQIDYFHFLSLGGRRKVNPDSKNTVWNHPSFRAYADYMETEKFKEALRELEAFATNERTAIMCSEAVWWSCHRSMIADALKSKGWQVYHIMNLNKQTEHPYTKPAKIIDGLLSYHN
ncbi:DUF488 family protein [Xanthomarina sp. GH4-25]|uniref:DUF488 domain-containing protein n=1 Tax=Xanthomarina sp. GH4-25 TaxID=3349335 RepID=UPI000D67EB9D|nr:Fe-S cluster assembly protein HesB [Flavobacteriaceae bacterium LYZ1037]